MQMTMRWFGPTDPVPPVHTRQVPGMPGIVSALHHVAVGTAWTRTEMKAHAALIDAAALQFAVVERIPVHEEIKLGAPSRDRWLDAFRDSVRVVGEAGVPVVCYNVMPVFDWMRTDLAQPQADGSTTLTFAQAALESIDLSQGTGDLPGWATAYSASEMHAQLAAWRAVERSSAGRTSRTSWSGWCRWPRRWA